MLYMGRLETGRVAATGRNWPQVAPDSAAAYLRGMAGQPTKLTPEIIAEVKRLLPVVLYLETVGDYLGISRMTWRNWLKRGSQEKRRLDKGISPDPAEALNLQFFDAFKKGMADGQLADSERIQLGALESWQASAWRLERRFPERWSNQRREIAELKKMVAQLLADREAAPHVHASRLPAAQPTNGHTNGNGSNGHSHN